MDVRNVACEILAGVDRTVIDGIDDVAEAFPIEIRITAGLVRKLIAISQAPAPLSADEQVKLACELARNRRDPTSDAR